MMRIARLLLLAAAVALALSCSRDAESDRVRVGEPSAPKGDLVVTVAADASGTGRRTWTLTCEPAGGNHPDPAAACRDLSAVQRPFAPVPRSAICTDIYGGSAVATLKGTWYGQAVDARYTRENGCQISRYDSLGDVLPGPVPGQPAP